jgi:hypothetical protein
MFGGPSMEADGDAAHGRERRRCGEGRVRSVARR